MITRRRLVHGMVLGAAATALPLPALAQPSDAARAAMAGAAAAFLAALPGDGRRRAVFPFEDKERLNWHYVPTPCAPTTPPVTTRDRWLSADRRPGAFW